MARRLQLEDVVPPADTSIGANTPVTHPLTRVDTCSSVSTNATAPNLEGAGRTVGLLFDYLGNNLESFIKTRSKPSKRQQPEHPPLARIESISSIDTNATAPNLEGAGRTVGLVLDWLGGSLESFMKKRAVQLGYGPESVARDIRLLRHHHEIWIGRRYRDAIVDMPTISKSEMKKLRKLNKRLLKYTRYASTLMHSSKKEEKWIPFSLQVLQVTRLHNSTHGTSISYDTRHRGSLSKRNLSRQSFRAILLAEIP